MSELSFIHSPLWFIPAVLLAGLMVYGLYFRKTIYSKKQRIALAALRFLSLLLLTLLLLRPIIWQEEELLSKPNLVWLEDGSTSVQKSDSLAHRTYLSKKQELQKALEDKFKIKNYHFSDKLYDDSVEQRSITNIERSINEVEQLYYGQDLAAVVLSTDGISNRGRRVNEINPRADFPLFVLAQGESNAIGQLQISGIRVNEEVLLGRVFQVEFDLKAINLKDADLSLILRDSQGKELERRNYKPSNSRWYNTGLFELNAAEIGRKVYQLQLKDAQDSLVDSRSFSVSIKQNQILCAFYVQESHPDIAALARALSRDPLNKIEYYKSIAELEAAKPDLIFGSQPKAELMDWLEKQSKPAFLMIGPNRESNYLKTIFGRSTAELEKQYARLNPNFGFFSLGPEQESLLKDYPPLDGIYGPRKLSSQAEILFYKSLEGIETNEALAFLEELPNGQRRVNFLARGLWRWRIHNYRMAGNFEAFDDMINSLAQYLLAQEKKEPLQIKWPRELFAKQRIKVQARLYDKTHKLNNSKALVLKLFKESNLVGEYRFSPYRAYYQLILDGLEAGLYQYEVATIEEKSLKRSGSIFVQNNDLEVRDLQARHQELMTLAQGNGGEFFLRDQVDSLQVTLQQMTAPAQISLVRNKDEILSRWPLFFVILALLALEWFLRKYWGQY